MKELIWKYIELATAYEALHNEKIGLEKYVTSFDERKEVKQ